MDINIKIKDIKCEECGCDYLDYRIIKDCKYEELIVDIKCLDCREFSRKKYSLDECEVLEECKIVE